MSDNFLSSSEIDSDFDINVNDASENESSGVTIVLSDVAWKLMLQ